jgi:rRNA-processing protein FCF1
MAQVYIDTNVFLDFYQAATDRIAVFAEIVGRATRIVMPEQSIVEFYRNRAGRLAELARKIADAPPPSLFTSWARRSESRPFAAQKVGHLRV